MFKNLTNFAYKRNTKEAVGFYFAYLFLIILLGALFGGLAALIIGQEDNFELGMRIGSLTSIVITIGVSFLILKKKNLLKNFSYIILILFSGLLAYLGGGLLSLIPVSFLTTRESQKSPTNKTSDIKTNQTPNTSTPTISDLDKSN